MVGKFCGRLLHLKSQGNDSKWYAYCNIASSGVLRTILRRGTY